MKELEWLQNVPNVTLWELSVAIKTRMLIQSRSKPSKGRKFHLFPKSEDETSIFLVLTVKSFCQYTGCRFETDWVNIILAVK